MALPVADLSSNAAENIAHAAKVIGRSAARRLVFNGIYTGKARIKGAEGLGKTVGLSTKRVLEEAKRLIDNKLVLRASLNGRMAYEKIDFFHAHKRNILALAQSPAKLRAYPTKRNPAHGKSMPERLTVSVRIPSRKDRAVRIDVDDIDSFAKVRQVPSGQGYTKISETAFKQGVARILGEVGRFKDWGGESRDLMSTRLKLYGKRRVAAFAFKGPGMMGRLTPGKMGKNGDQIQRLLKCQADVFIVQYWNQMEDSVLELLESLSRMQAYMQERPIWYGIIDGDDSTRLIQAYPSQFSLRARKTKARGT
jgi:hypothetical protein